jgi:hypothetical protein
MLIVDGRPTLGGSTLAGPFEWNFGTNPAAKRG